MSQTPTSQNSMGSWDVIVIGAGPAGSAAASACSMLGLSTLLVEKAAFPRSKVCGGCLSPAGVRALEDLGALPAIRPHAIPIDGFRLLAQGQSHDFPLQAAGLAISRESLDFALFNHAQSLGATAHQSCAASLVDSSAAGCHVRLTQDGISTEVTAKAIVVADGLAGSFLPREKFWSPHIARRSRFGIGTLIAPGIVDHLVPGRSISMHVGRVGYLGLVRLRDGSIDAAAALDPVKTKALGGPAPAIASILHECKQPVPPEFASLAWHGMPLLTRSRRPEAPGIFVVGDAAAYVEPFTGEGMSWAIQGGIAVASHVQQQSRGVYEAGAWTDALARVTASRRRACGVVAAMLRVPSAVRCALHVCAWAPSLVQGLRNAASGPWDTRRGWHGAHE